MGKPADELLSVGVEGGPYGRDSKIITRAYELLDECEETLRVLRDCTDSPTQHAIIDDTLAKLRGEQ